MLLHVTRVLPIAPLIFFSKIPSKTREVVQQRQDKFKIRVCWNKMYFLNEMQIQRILSSCCRVIFDSSQLC